MIRNRNKSGLTLMREGGMILDAITVADVILRIAKSKQRQLTPLQLMKLAYISHGFSLAVRGIPLFHNQIQAWKYGPVIPDLYRATKGYGRDAIPFEMIEDGQPEMVDQETYDFLEEVVDKYSDLSGIALSNLTHQTGTPWDVVFKQGNFNQKIPNDIIQDHYREIINV